MTARYMIRPEPADLFKVIDLWTGEPAMIARTPQQGLSRGDAEHLADLLNRREEAGDRSSPPIGEPPAAQA